MPKKGQRQPYQVWFVYPNQEAPSTFSQRDIATADRTARQVAEHGATAHVLLKTSEGRRFRLFTYRPDHVPPMDIPAGMRSQDEYAWIADWYRCHGEPVEVRKTGAPLPLKAARIPTAPSPTTAQPNPVAQATSAVILRESSRTLFGPVSPVVLKAGLDSLGLATEGTTENGDYIVSPATLAELVKLAMRAPKDR